MGRPWLIVLLAGCQSVFGLEAPTQRAPDDAPAPVAGRWSYVTAGTSHVCALDADRQLFCWGDNRYGGTGTGSALWKTDVPTQVAGTWTAVSAGGLSTCGVRDDSTLWCWGLALGATGVPNQLTPAQIGSTGWSSVTLARTHACALKTDNSLYCWGANGAGQLGDGTTEATTKPELVPSNQGWSAVAVSDDATCALDTASSLWCWGDNASGLFGAAVPASSLEPVPMSMQYARIALARRAGCGITLDGALRCWGRNTNGEIGDGSTMARDKPTAVAVPAGLSWSDVHAFAATACARTSDGRVFCWGSSANGQLGTFDDAITTPIEIGSSDVAQVALGGGLLCVRGSDSMLRCAGRNGYSQLADGGTSSNVPLRVPGTWASVATGFLYTCATTMDGQMSCAGANTVGQLGSGTLRPQMAMERVSSLGEVDRMAAGVDHVCASTNGTAHCWGGNYYAQLGLNDLVDRTTPVAVREGYALAALHHTCSIDIDEALWCWGVNERGQLGRGTSGSPQGPAVVNLTAQWTQVAVGRLHSCGLEAGNLHCWGDRFKVGINAPMQDVLAPTYTGLSDIDDVTAGWNHTCAISSTGVARCWGSNYAGQLGVGDLMARQLPTSVPGVWATIAGGSEHSCGIQTNGTLWCWGSNVLGQLGTGDYTSRTSPVQVGAAMNWRAVAVHTNHSCATNEGGELYCWGDNNDGELATGDAWQAALVAIP